MEKVELKRLLKRTFEHCFMTKFKVRIFGVRIHHAYVGLAIIFLPLFNNFQSLIPTIDALRVFFLGGLVVLHDAIAHIATRLASRRLASKVKVNLPQLPRINLLDEAELRGTRDV